MKKVPVLVSLIIVNVLLLLSIAIEGLRRHDCNKQPFVFKVHTNQQRIVGGRLALAGYYPFMAGIVIKERDMQANNSLQCGCAIIALTWVITAAHCLTLIEQQDLSRDDVYISAGHNMWTKGNKHYAILWTYHPKYDEDILNNDIGLIRVKQQFNKKNEKPVALAAEKYKYLENKTVKILGWGVKSSKSKIVQQNLNVIEVQIFNHSYCQKLYRIHKEMVTKTMLCAGHPKGGRDACQFDSGGPMLDRSLLIGIISWGLDCGVKKQPGVYTKVSFYKKWIINVGEKANAPIKATYRNA
ncbi:hypothetical protein ILUMI_19506 [Ignelater luminosus]|uniref:Peptidase S1 domain-containing protein n=1 Tax=Ignelater luminosus TaxID=2038154 RepID=A0A8K0CK26_IGNLU|nr:hypothetical protein ILUMI_19506 [Ignelater luminosus]